MKTEGLERLTMRRLAADLDTGPASLYVYFQNAAVLHARVLDELLEAVESNLTSAGSSWSDDLVDLLSSYTTILIEYPDLAKSALVTRPSGTNYLTLVEHILKLLREGAIPDSHAAWGVDLLLLFATSIALEHGTRMAMAGIENDGNELRSALENANGDTYPSIAALGADLLSGSPEDKYKWHVRAILSGIGATPREGDVPLEDDSRA